MEKLLGVFMKWTALFFTLVLWNVSFAGEHEGGTHTPNYCSTTNAKVCAHLIFDELPKTTSASEFIVHVLSSSGAQVENMKVKLWMDMGNGHGHGSAPVVVSPLDELNHFYVQKAYFVMRGQWQVLVTFTEAGEAQKIIIPLDINE